MKQNVTAIFKIGAVAIAVALATGCATSQQLEEVRAIAEEARGTANEARDAAANAERQAADALSAAQEAERLAQQAQNCCDANRERIDRMFEQLQEK